MIQSSFFPSVRSLLRRARTVRAVVLLSAALLAAGALALPTAALGAQPLRPGLGHRLPGGDFVGFYVDASGTPMYCVDPRAAAPTSVSLSSVSRMPGASSEVTRELAYALRAWGAARTSDEAAVESQVLNTLVGNSADVARRARALPGRLAAAVTGHVRLARELAGPYLVRVSMAPLTPGQSGSGTVQVLSGARRPVDDVALTLHGSSSVAVPAGVRTGRDGTGRFRYTVTGVGEVRVDAVATGLASDRVLASRPPAGVQRMVSAASPERAGASTAFRQALSGFSNAYACSSQCDGHPSVALTACAPASTLSSRIDYHAGDQALSWTFAPSRSRTCHTSVATIADGTAVTAYWRYRAGNGWTNAVSAPGGFTVDCPAVPAVTVSSTAACQVASVTIALSGDGVPAPDGPWTNPTQHAMVLVVGGSQARRIVAEPGQGAVFTATRSCSDPSTFTAQAGVQRVDGQWNYGHVVTLTTPGP